jgi:hypothetical protein
MDFSSPALSDWCSSSEEEEIKDSVLFIITQFRESGINGEND